MRIISLEEATMLYRSNGGTPTAEIREFLNSGADAAELPIYNNIEHDLSAYIYTARKSKIPLKVFRRKGKIYVLKLMEGKA